MTSITGTVSLNSLGINRQAPYSNNVSVLTSGLFSCCYTVYNMNLTTGYHTLCEGCTIQ